MKIKFIEYAPGMDRQKVIDQMNLETYMWQAYNFMIYIGEIKCFKAETLDMTWLNNYPVNKEAIKVLLPNK